MRWMHHLDDANVGKFTNMIRKFSDNSQFIIVTHKQANDGGKWM